VTPAHEKTCKSKQEGQLRFWKTGVCLPLHVNCKLSQNIFWDKDYVFDIVIRL